MQELPAAAFFLGVLGQPKIAPTMVLLREISPCDSYAFVSSASRCLYRPPQLLDRMMVTVLPMFQGKW